MEAAGRSRRPSGSAAAGCTRGTFPRPAAHQSNNNQTIPIPFDSLSRSFCIDTEHVDRYLFHSAGDRPAPSGRPWPCHPIRFVYRYKTSISICQWLCSTASYFIDGNRRTCISMVVGVGVAVSISISTGTYIDS